MVAHGPPQWPQYIATEFGWLKQDNIEFDFVTVGAAARSSSPAGALNIAHSGYPDFARASLQGAPVKIIINDIVASPYAVFAKPQHQADRRSQGQADQHRRHQRHDSHLYEGVPGLGRIED